MMKNKALIQDAGIAAMIAANRAPDDEQEEKLQTFAQGLEQLLVKLYRQSKKDTLFPRIGWVIAIPFLWALVITGIYGILNIGGKFTLQGNPGQTAWESVSLLPSWVWIVIGILTIVSIWLAISFFGANKMVRRYVSEFAPLTGKRP